MYKLRRAVTWNEGGVLDGARHIVLAGEVAYITAARGLGVNPTSGAPQIHFDRTGGQGIRGKQ